MRGSGCLSSSGAPGWTTPSLGSSDPAARIFVSPGMILISEEIARIH